MNSMQLCGLDEISIALDNDEEISLVLVSRENRSNEVTALLERVEEAGIPIREGSNNDLWRMAKDNKRGTPEILALAGRQLEGDLSEVCARGGVLWLMSGAQYAVNIGYVIRTAEVSGANAIIIDAGLNSNEKKTAVRASMKAHRFLPVFWNSTEEALTVAKQAGMRIVAVEDCGDIEPWDADLTGDVLLIVGGEHDGISETVLEQCDQIIKIPMGGFVPSYNLQAPMAIVAIEALRQQREN